MQQARAGRGLRTAAWLLLPVGLVLMVAGIGFARTDYEGVTVRGQAMEPTYQVGDRLVTEVVDTDAIRRGDVVLVDVPGRYGGAPVLQRVIGVGGDHVESPDGERVEVNGEPLDEPYLTREDFPAVHEPYDVHVPEGRLFLLGDNRANSNDSRYFLDDRSGSVAASGVLGRVVDNPAVPYTLVALGIVGGVLTLTGIGLGIGGYATGRRARRTAGWGAPPSPGVWPGARGPGRGPDAP
ncbi:signal peptidase I [Streptomyces sp. KLOTTS4A1]|uniref:signal peptidase I n=1 Tax=Streptomyces sp. KLOTTS4A1 TaxID=3390996 RepID=UPI0039F5BDBE